MRQVEYLVTNANAPELILAITKELYVETMVQHGEGEGSSESTSSQASSTLPQETNWSYHKKNDRDKSYSTFGDQSKGSKKLQR